jgi:hypothetical protein
MNSDVRLIRDGQWSKWNFIVSGKLSLLAAETSLCVF